ncbi:hypothetical protein [Proteus mirabilis]|uniref:hypothetical protein n=1 Tax=Proteus mirabilis TaxID=584 RepID=UPI0024E16339|nr:hypothetical protein [Proteus mirabilis]
MPGGSNHPAFFIVLFDEAPKKEVAKALMLVDFFTQQVGIDALLKTKGNFYE